MCVCVCVCLPMCVQVYCGARPFLTLVCSEQAVPAQDSGGVLHSSGSGEVADPGAAHL